MTTHELQLTQIKPETQRWTIKVIVVEKSHAKTSPAKGTRYQSVILMDLQV